MYERAHGLTDQDIDYIDYIDARNGRNMMLGAYEPGHLIDGYMVKATYELADTKMLIHDPTWGEEIIGDKPHDALLIELARTPLFRRLQSIEQLTLGPDHATMPNSMYFSRWQHIWGSLVFVRKMPEGRDEVDPRHKMVLQLRTLLSDVGHTAFSHLGDWIFQGLDGGEDMHDRDLKDILRVSGLEEILERHGFTVEETVFPEVSDWVECPSPDLCVDRVDYGFREILRWVVPTIPLNMYFSKLQNPQILFTIDETGRLLMKDALIARYYAAGFSILPTEHWSHPVHRLQLQLLQSAVRAAVIDKVSYNSTHPREALYGIDNDFYAHFQTWDLMHLQDTMKQIATEQRRIFITARRADLERVFGGIQEPEWQFPAFPDPLKPYSWQSQQYGYPYSPRLYIEESNEPGDGQMTATERGLQVFLPPLKARAIDPLVDNGDGVKRLSEIDPSYKDYLGGQRAVMGKSYVATILMRRDVAERIVAHHREVEEEWPDLLRRPRNPKQLGRIIMDAELPAATRHFDEIYEVDDESIPDRSQLFGNRALRAASQND